MFQIKTTFSDIIHALIYVFIFSSTIQLFGQCPDDDFLIFNSQAEIDDFGLNYPNCTEVEEIYLEGGDISDLSPLAGIIMSGALSIYECNQLINLEGLNLQTTAVVEISACEEIISLSGLGNMTSLDNLFLTANPKLVDISALENLDDANSMSIEIIDNPLLEFCGYGFICYNIIEFPQGVQIDGNASGCSDFEEIQNDCGLECPEVELIFDSQQDVDDFANNYPNCPELNVDVQIFGNDITNLNGLASLISAPSIEIFDANNLTDLSGFESLENVDVMIVEGCAQLSDLSHLNDIEISHLTMKGLDELTSLDFISGINQLTSLEIIHCVQLSDLSGLSGMTSIDHLVLDQIETLQTLSGLENMQQIGFLALKRNDLLTDISALETLASIDMTTIIENNPLLSVCDYDFICELLEISPSDITVSGNDIGCSSLAELTDSCNPGECPASDVYLESQSDIDAFFALFPNCTELNVSVSITGDDVTNLNGFTNIAHILGGNSLYISNAGNLNDLSGFQNLMEVGDLEIINCDQLTDLSGFANLSTLNTLTLSGNEILSDLNGLANLETSAEQITIIENPNLAVCDFDFVCNTIFDDLNLVTISDNDTGCNTLSEVFFACNNEEMLECPIDDVQIFDSQEDVDLFGLLFPSCTIFPGEIQILGNTITDLTPLASLEEVGTLILSFGNFENLSALNNLLTINHIIIEDCGIESMNGLNENLSIGTLEIGANNDFDDCAGLEFLTSLEKLILQESLLRGLEGLEQLNEVTDSVIIRDNSRLKDCKIEYLCNILPGSGVDFIIENNQTGCVDFDQMMTYCDICQGTLIFYNQEDIDELVNSTINHCSLLQGSLEITESLNAGGSPISDLSGLSFLKKITGNLEIGGNSMLSQLEGLNNINSVGFKMIISDNENLTDITALENAATNYSLEGIYSPNFVVTENPQLTECAALSLCNYMLDPYNLYLIENNGAGCSSVEDVKETCNYPIYELSDAGLDECSESVNIFISANNGNLNTPINVLDGTGKIICTIDPNGQELGMVNFEIFRSSEPRFWNGSVYLNRDYSITPQFQPLASTNLIQSPTVTFYYSQSEMDELIENGSNPSINFESIDIVKSPHACEGEYDGDGFLTDNGFSFDYDLNVYSRVSRYSSFSTFHGFEPGAFIPVELVYFDGKFLEDKVKLNWQTASEINNEKFEIEHSIDGVAFEKIGVVDGSGTTTNVVDYNFLHLQPSRGDNYYRLKQIDFDGSFAYSEILHLKNNQSPKFKLYPNPVKEKLFLSGVSEDASAIIFDHSGRQVTKIDAVGTEINTGFLSSGLYILKIMTPDQHQLESKFIVE